MPFESVKVPIGEIVDFEPGELRALRFKMPDSIDMRHRRPGNAFWARIWGDKTRKLEVRAYSFSDGTTRRIVETVVSKAAKDPNTSLFLQRVKVGDEIEIRIENGSRKLFINPRKDLKLERDNWWPHQKFLFLGLGSGVAPHLSVIRYMATMDFIPDSIFVVSAKNHERLIFHDELKKIALNFPNFSYLPFLTRIPPENWDLAVPDDWHYYSGRPNLAALVEAIPDISERHVRVCGGGGVRKIFEEEARKLGIKFQSIRSEEW